MVMVEMVMGQNDSGPKMSSHWQMASDTSILKFSSVSEFHRQNSDNRNLRMPFLFA